MAMDMDSRSELQGTVSNAQLSTTHIQCVGDLVLAYILADHPYFPYCTVASDNITFELDSCAF
ncbi:hypothetical protein SDJN02_20135 [Cucurbita argyrosperma subsp. argyrosperma]|nr:hypothetical protein SDJN02_20135 [Cucurbita argyrosperma subsp. argyrosperma]